MAVRKQHSRQSKNYIIENINGVMYYIEPETYVSKSVIYTAKKNIISNNLVIPIELLNTGRPILVICKGKGKYNFSII